MIEFSFIKDLKMIKKRELSYDLRNKIVKSNEEGMGYKSLSKKFDVPASTIQSIIKKYKLMKKWKTWVVEEEKEKCHLEAQGRLYKLSVKIQGLPQKKFCKTWTPLVSKYLDRHCKGLCMIMAWKEEEHERLIY